jgi:hypothetical protein
LGRQKCCGRAKYGTHESKKPVEWLKKKIGVFCGGSERRDLLDVGGWSI